MSEMQISSDVASIVKQGLGAKGVAAFQKMGRAAASLTWDEPAKQPRTQDKISFSDAAIAAFEEQLAVQAKAQASNASAADRYAAAQAEGKSVDAWIENHKDRFDPTKNRIDFTDPNALVLESVDIDKLCTAMYGTGETTIASKQGTVVTVEDARGRPPYPTRITRSDGLQLTLNVSDDVRINDLEDGTLSLYFPSTGKTCLFDSAGVMRVEEGEPNQSGTGGDDIIINVNGSVVDGGDGDDTIFNFANNTTITGGNGDDTVFMNTSSGNTITMGDGNDRLVGKTLNNSHVDMGEGDNVVSMQHITGGTLRAGDGNNEIIANNINGKATVGKNQLSERESTGSMSLGNGNNSITFGSFTGGAQMQVGDGNNTIKSNSTGISAASSLHLGDGDNAIALRGMNDGASLTAGNGNNHIFVHDVSNNSAVNIGDGKNTYAGSSAANDSHISLGNGGNIIWLTGGIHNQSSIKSGAGDDIIHVSYVLPGGSIDAGGGNDIIHTESVSGSISGGAGDDTIIVEGPTYGSVHGDAGTNTLVVGEKAFGKSMGSLSDTLLSLRKAQLASERYATQAGIRGSR